jgi:predicted XRE-type DNA-binding protein
MGEDKFEMSQKQRDRLKVLHEVAQGKLKQTEAAEQLKLSTRQVRRLVKKMASLGDRAIVHGLQGRGSNRAIDPEIEKRCMNELGKPECRDFGPTYATEHLQKKLEVKVGRDTARKWMVAAGMWRVRSRKQASVHQWRPRRSCCGELVQWDTSVHAWLEDRGPQLYLIAMIDDATSRLFGRFVEHDSTQENMRTLRRYLELYGRPLDFYTDKAAMFEVAPKRAGGESEPMAPTQITRALTELGIGRISAHSPQAKGRVERCFGTLQDRLVKHLRLAKARTLEQANAELEKFLKEWNERFTEAPANATDAHRPLGECDLDATLSFVKHPRVENNYTFSFFSKRYQIAKSDARPGLRGQKVRVEQRLDGTVAARDQDRYLDIRRCESPEPATPSKAARPVRKDHNRGGRSSWMQGFTVRSDAQPLRS